jgi:hypothetical protein
MGMKWMKGPNTPHMYSIILSEVWKGKSMLKIQHVIQPILNPMIYGTNSNTQDIQAHITFEIFVHLSMFVSIYTEPCGGSDAESANSTVVKSKPLDPWHGR